MPKCICLLGIAAMSIGIYSAAISAPAKKTKTAKPIKPLIIKNIGVTPKMSKSDPIEKKITELMAKMSLEEKIGQLSQYGGGLDANGEKDLAAGKVGSVLSIGGNEEQIRDRVNQLQKIAVEKSRLGIPLIVGHDIIHGCRTTFPIPLGIGATFDPESARIASRFAATEARASGISWTFAPMIDVARDARWGRTAEGCGEDPYLTAQMGAAMVKGFQGDDLSAQNAVAACAKHFTAYGAGEGGRDYDTADLSQQTLYNVYLYPYIDAVKAGMQTVMPSFNEVGGMPMSCNKELLTDWLKDKVGFDGFAVSDANAVYELINHKVAADRAEAAKLAVEAGMDMDMGSNCFRDTLAEQVKSGAVSMKTIDEACRRVLRVKFRLGLFEHPYTDVDLLSKINHSPEAVAATRKAAQKSIVLLKNEGNLLPLAKSAKSIAVIGPLAADAYTMIGTWGGLARGTDCVSILDGIKQAASTGTQINYAQGCSLPGRYFDADANKHAASTKGIPEAVEAARKSDIVVLAIGEHAGMSGEASSRSSIELPGVQQQLVEAVCAVGKPVVVILCSGRAMAIPWIAQNVPSILAVWHPGNEAGHAIADVVFGDYNPGGRLPVTFPPSTGFCPMYYNHKNTGRPIGSHNIFSAGYCDAENKPVYPFGHGLSYTTFEYTNLKVEPSSNRLDAEVKVSVDVENTGSMLGDEVVQLYLQDVVANPTRPVKELKGFQRITLQPGATKHIEFVLDSAKIGYFNNDGNIEVQPGLFKVWVGGSSEGGLEGNFTLSSGAAVKQNSKDDGANTGYVGGVIK